MTLTAVSKPLVGLEEISRAATIFLIEELDKSIDNVNSYWQTRDTVFNNLRGSGLSIALEKPASALQYHHGDNPAMLTMGIDEYPNLAIFAFNARPTGDSDQRDQQSVYGVALAVEFMVKSETSADDSYSRAQRMLEAINMCLMSNPSLGVLGVNLGPEPRTVLVGNAVLRNKEQKGQYGPKFWMQGGRLDYTVSKSAIAAPDSPVFAVPGADIDQA